MGTLAHEAVSAARGRWRYLPLLLAGGVAAAQPAVAPDPDRTLSEYAYHYWTIDDGVPQNTVMGLAQDHSGYLWLATFEGLARFDGIHFRSYRNADFPGLHRGTTNLLLARDGALWVGTQADGVFRIGADGEVRAYGEAEGLPRPIVWSLAQDHEGRLWVGTVRGLCQLVGERFRCLDDADGVPATQISALHAHADGGLWIGTRDLGLLRLQAGAVERWHDVEGRGFGQIQDIASGPDGRVWVATFGAGLVEIDSERRRIWDTSDGLSSDLIHRVLVDAAGAVWVGTYGAGLNRLHEGRVEVLDSGAGLPNGHVQSLLVDREGGLWFGTSGGLNRLHAARFTAMSVREGLATRMARVVAEAADGTIWVGTDSDGVSVIRGRRVVEQVAMPTLPSGSVRALWPAAGGGMWVGTYGGGITRVGPDGEVQHYTKADGLPDDQVRALLEDRRRRLWIGMERGGAALLEDGVLTHFPRLGPRGATDVRAIAEAPDGAIWFGTYGSGLIRYTDGAMDTVPGMPDAIVFAIHFGEDGTWVGAEDGLWYHDGAGARRVGGAAGLDTAVFQVLPGAAGQLWLCTNRGILTIDESAAREGTEPLATRAYDRSDGMLSRQCNGASQPAGWSASDGRVWFPTADGVVWTSPAELPADPLPPLVVQEVRVDGVAQPTDRGIELAPGTRRLDIDYAALTFDAPRKVSYRYRLDGYDTGWIDAGSRRSASYNGLPPGRYQFQVIAGNADGVWNHDGIQLAVTQQPWLYQTRWFQAAMAGLALLLLMTFIRWRSRELRHRNEALEGMVDERTRKLAAANDDLAQTLGELRATQTKLVEAEKMAALGGLVAGVAHEINTPVGNAITVASHLKDRVRTRRSDEQSMVEGLHMIESNLERARQVVSSFKRVAVDRDRARRGRVVLAELIESVRLDLAHRLLAGQHRLAVSCPADLVIDSYPDVLHEVLAQLIDNSLEHAFDAPGGTIEIECRRIERGVALSYRDDGVGITEAARDHLFEPFFTSRRSSHPGLGLHIVYNHVTRILGGEIEHLPASGSHFRIVVPA